MFFLIFQQPCFSLKLLMLMFSCRICSQSNDMKHGIGWTIFLYRLKKNEIISCDAHQKKNSFWGYMNLVFFSPSTYPPPPFFFVGDEVKYGRAWLF